MSLFYPTKRQFMAIKRAKAWFKLGSDIKIALLDRALDIDKRSAREIGAYAEGYLKGRADERRAVQKEPTR